MSETQIPELTEVEFHQATPRPPLDQFVDVIWSVKGTSFYRREAVLPNGAIELMINFGSLQRVLAIGEQRAAADHREYWLSGLQTGPLSVESTAESHLISIRFKPGGAAPFLGLPVDECRDQVIEASSLFGRQVDDLRSDLAIAEGFPGRVNLIERWLMARLSNDLYEYELVGRATRMLQADMGAKRIGDVCEELGLSNKHLIALFRRVVGLPPKALARILRFDAVLASLQQAEDVDWASLANQHHFFDQSHLIHDFRRLTGVSPMTYMEQRSPDGGSLILG